MKTGDIIRQSNTADIRAIHSWLQQEEDDQEGGNFFHNWELIQGQHKQGQLTVYVDGATSTPVAYQLGGLISPGILQVRNDMRRKGIGKRLVSHCLDEARKKDHCFLHIQCTPNSSIPFWKAMGFTLFGDDKYRQQAYRILKKEHRLPKDGQKVHARILFYPEERKWHGGESVPPLESAAPAAVVTPDGVIHLSERVSFFEVIHPESRDAVIEIVINGERRFFDKAKYQEAKQLGVCRRSNGIYLDKIFPPSTKLPADLPAAE